MTRPQVEEFDPAAGVVAALLSGIVMGGCSHDSAAPPLSDTAAGSASATPDNTAAKEKEGLEVGVQAVVYGLPLVIMDCTDTPRYQGVAAETYFARNLW